MEYETVAQVDADLKFVGLPEEQPPAPGPEPDCAHHSLHLRWKSSKLDWELWQERDQRRKAAQQREEQAAAAVAAAALYGICASLSSDRRGTKRKVEAAAAVPAGQPEAAALDPGSAMAAAFPRVNELLAGEAYTKLAFNHNNPDPELRKVEEAGRVCPQRPPFYVPFGQGVSLFTKAVHGGVSRILMQSAALTPMKVTSKAQAGIIAMDMIARSALTRHPDIMPLFQRMVVTEPNIFDVYGHKHGLPDAVYDDSEQGARLRWRMAFGEHAPAQLPGMQVDADDNVVRCTPLSRAEQDTLLTLLFDIEIPGRQLPQQQQQQQQQQ